MNIIVSGCVGTGKTTLAKILSKKLDLRYINPSAIIKKKKLFDSYDKKMKSLVVDEKKFSMYFSTFMSKKENAKHNKGIILDSHLAHYINKKEVNYCIITKCDIGLLNKRLIKRRYTKHKIKENLQAEIFDVCFEEAREFGFNPIVIDTSQKIKIHSLIKKLR